MCASKLTELEKCLIRLFFNLCPQWKRIVSEQIMLSDLQRWHDFSNFSVYFMNNTNANRLRTNTKMPVEIIIGSVELPAGIVIKEMNGCQIITPCVVSVLDNDAIGVRIYFSDGILSELEVYSLSGKELCEDFKLDKQCTYIIFDPEIVHS